MNALTFYLSSDYFDINFKVYDQAMLTEHSFLWLYNKLSSKSFRLENATSGSWRIIVQSKATNVRISVETEISMDSIINKFNNNPEHADYVRLECAPITFDILTIFTSIQNANASISSLKMELMSEKGVLLTNLSPFKSGNMSFIAHFIVPNSKFRIKTTAVLQDVKIIERYVSELFAPSSLSVSLDMNKTNTITIGKDFEVIVRIENKGASSKTLTCILHNRIEVRTRIE